MADEKKSIKLIPVRQVSTSGKSTVVEYLDKKGLHRVYVPSEKVADKLDLELLEAAPAYGISWADMPIKPVSGDELQAALYAAGVWTDKDLRKQAPIVVGVLQALYQLHLGSLVEFAERNKLNEVK